MKHSYQRMLKGNIQQAPISKIYDNITMMILVVFREFFNGCVPSSANSNL